ncbi:TetR family transcriptional regulator [Flavobacterium rakeshii]|uniref:TetR family transcriptional regulator n=1 Tax=Flavobacterium rakeshii TaxID=1038845 RepID=A0A6N8HGF3_9FLAO|nr:TetR/AcrR family transcriptional regulator [Flavobacterium rakeshii]MUV04812.1 TetR family transcriptional regulator [Flavobacterium rakeshii]
MSKADRTRQFIIEKTAPIFNRKGYAGTSLADLTEATGLTKGSIYGNFKNKDEVAVAAFNYNFGLMSDWVKERITIEPDPIKKLKVYITIFSNFTENPVLRWGCPVLNSATEVDDTHVELRENVVEAIRKWHSSIVRIINTGKEQGKINPDVDTDSFAWTLLALIEGGVMLVKVTGKINTLNAAMRHSEKIIDELAI